MDKAYILMGCINYEGCRPIEVYLDQDKANAALAVAEEYHDTMPKATGSEWTDYEMKLEEWRDNHPATPDDDYFTIYVEELKQ